ncbi:hypothetical protein MKW98_013515 [Papaver atlanticum]|uniref:Uncharacterized protein n=1 Tax=Papaver atlanticum TaxID=357466 RepID=A0AAD4STD2_9MAGN|nr:hypothetical protein MKW98_013515 [Papaver atlanticum]
MIPDLADWVRENDFSSDEDDDKAFFWGENDDYNFCMSTESESDGDEGDRKRKPQVGTGTNDATILGNEKQKSEVSGTGMDAELDFHDGVSAKKSSKKTDGDASEEDMSTEVKEKEKRKLQEDGVESEQNDGIEASIEVKKK